MKILQVTNSLATGGAEKLLLDLLPLYKREGFRMDILVLDGTNYPFMKALIAEDCCDIYSISSRSIYHPLNVFKIIQFIRNYDLVHVHLFPALYWVALAKWISFSQVKLIFTEHNTSNRRMQNMFFKYVDRFIYRRYERIVCITESIKGIMQNYVGSDISKFEVIKNGVNLDLIRVSAAYKKMDISNKLNASDFLLIQVAGFREQKDQNTLIRSLIYVPKDVKLALVGDGVLRRESEDLVLKLELTDRVFFLGQRMDILPLIKTADVVVLSTKYEGLSLSSIEGMACGRPFVASDVPGLSILVKGAGILFRQGDPKELAENIIILRNNKDYYEQVSRSCQLRASEYDITTVMNEHLKLYEELYQA